MVAIRSPLMCAAGDIEDGDAHLMPGVADETYDFVYSSSSLSTWTTP